MKFKIKEERKSDLLLQDSLLWCSNSWTGRGGEESKITISDCCSSWTCIHSCSVFNFFVSDLFCNHTLLQRRGGECIINIFDLQYSYYLSLKWSSNSLGGWDTLFKWGLKIKKYICCILGGTFSCEKLLTAYLKILPFLKRQLIIVNCNIRNNSKLK